MREYKLSDGSRFLIRPSGTEPKLKCYIEAVDKGMVAVKEKQRVLKKYVEQVILL